MIANCDQANINPRVSIGLPVFNGENYIGRAIESILNQTFSDFELIISDNASTDRTGEICRDYAKTDQRIGYNRNARNLGAAKNFNRTFELSRGIYFKWIAADEEIEPDFLEQCVDLLDNNPDVVLACSKYILVDEIRGFLTRGDYDHNLRNPLAYKRLRKIVGAKKGSEHPVWGVIRSNVLKDTQLIRPIIGCDSFLVVELALKGEFGQVPGYLNRLRIHDEAYSTKLRRENRDLDGMQGEREVKWLNTDHNGMVILPHWRLLREYFLLVTRSRERLWQKCLMISSLFYPLGFRWRTILVKEIFFVAGLGKTYVRIRDAIKKGTQN